MDIFGWFLEHFHDTGQEERENYNPNQHADHFEYHVPNGFVRDVALTHSGHSHNG